MLECHVPDVEGLNPQRHCHRNHQFIAIVRGRQLDLLDSGNRDFPTFSSLVNIEQIVLSRTDTIWFPRKFH